MEKISPSEASRRIQQLDAEYKAYQEKYKSNKAEIRKLCKHKWEYQPDASGNNDSGYFCFGCGDWTKRL